MLKCEGLRSTLTNIWDIVSTFPVKQRKRLVLLCRAQEVVFNQPFNLLAIQTGFNCNPSMHDLEPAQRQLIHLALNHQDYIKSPILSSVILDMCRSAPLRGPDIEEQKLASWGKEISVCEKTENPLHFDYACWFDESNFGRPLVVGTPPNPEMARRIHHSLLEWRQKMTGKIFYPRMSRKMVSRSTVREWESLYGRTWNLDDNANDVEMTQETLEKIYHQDGLEIGGLCEMRQKWYKSGVVPRTYFAQGGYAYSRSKYIQEIASSLTETLMTTHPISRLNPARIVLKSALHYLRIYDLTVFTSNHWECKHFVEQLSEFCIGIEIFLIDAREGLLPADLGELISGYNTSMNYYPGYSLERIDELFSEVTEFHNRAGFLGVYGNINFSTYLHGASLLMLLQSEDEANVAGDDAHYSCEPGTEDIADRIIDANGLLEVTKTFKSDQVGAVCLKRGLIQIEQRCLPKIMLVFPSFSNVGELFGYNAPQFPDKQSSKIEKRAKVGNEIYRFLRAIHTSGIKHNLDEAYDLLQAIYTSASFPRQGSLPPYGDILIPVLPDSAIAFSEISPLELLLRNHFSSGVVVPKIIEPFEKDVVEDPILQSGMSWVGWSTRKLKYLEVLEYVAKEEIHEVLWGIQAYNRIVDVFMNRGRKIYTYTCIRDVPVYLASIPEYI